MSVLPSPPTLLVGRTRELATLHDRLARAIGGHGSLVLIGGEAGIGKTALAEAVCREGVSQGALVLSGRCFDLTETPPYGPWLELFADYQPIDAQPPLPHAFSQPSTVGAVASQIALFNQARGFLTALVTHQPVCLLLEDLHWADPASLDLLRSLARSLANMPVLIIVTYRADELTRRHSLYQILPVLVREAHADRLDLQRIEEADIRALVTDRYQLRETDAARLVTDLQHRSEGNPFFLGELLRTFEAERVLRHTGDGWTLGDLTHVRVPLLLRQVIDARLARLDEEAQRLLAVAAVIGQDVPLTLWTTIADTDAATLLGIMEQAAAAHLLDQTSDGTQARFVHALIRQTLYEGMLPSRRRVWHRRVGEMVAASVRPDPDTVAFHFRQAGDARATEWLIQAGDRAQHAYAWLTAVERFEAALAILEGSGADAVEQGWLHIRLWRLRRYAAPQQGVNHLDVAARLATQAGDAALTAYALREQGQLDCFLGNLGQGITELEAGIVASDSLAVTGEASGRVPGLDMGSHGGLATWLALAGRYAEALSLAQRLRVIDRAPIGSSRPIAIALSATGRLAEAQVAFKREQNRCCSLSNHYLLSVSLTEELAWVGIPYAADDLPNRQALADRAQAVWEQAREIHGEMPSRLVRLPLLRCEGAWAEMRQLAGAVLARQRAIRPWQCCIVGDIGILAYDQGDVDLAWQMVREWLPAGPSTEPGDTYYLPAHVLQRVAARLSIDIGDLTTAYAWLAAHDRWLAWSGTVLGRADGALGWASYYAATGAAAQARSYAMQALMHANAPRQPLALLATHRLLGELETDAGRFAAARTHLHAALALADACAAPYERALTLLALAVLRGATGAPTETHTLLHETQAICRSLGAEPALARIAAVIERLPTVPAAPARGRAAPGYLSARETEVLRLIVAGHTNQAIADMLSISKNTVMRHVAHILAKTGTENRAAAVAFALRHDLA